MLRVDNDAQKKVEKIKVFPWPITSLDIMHPI